MAKSTKTVVDHTGKTVEGVPVQVREAREQFSDIYLDDGTHLRIKSVVTEAIRVPGQWDNDGNPAYIIRSAAVVSITEVGEGLEKKVQ